MLLEFDLFSGSVVDDVSDPGVETSLSRLEEKGSQSFFRLIIDLHGYQTSRTKLTISLCFSLSQVHMR